MSEDGTLLSALEARLAAAHLRGQWQADANRPQHVGRNAAGNVCIEPVPAGSTHVWRWQDMQPLLEAACEAMPESYTARRALIFTNPRLPRGTTHTLLATLQVVRPGEVAWSHRHVINALRFSIQGGPQVFTVVDGRELAMEPYDLVLTPGWTWHDHHNESERDAIWVDALDVPFTLALNQQFYEETGEAAQPRTSADLGAPLFRAGRQRQPEARPYRYPWSEMAKVLDCPREIDPALGFVVDYVNPATGASVLPTIHCRVQLLPAGFAGRPFRSTASEVAFVIEGEGTVVLADGEVAWQRHDCIALPNWSWRRLINRSARERAVLFTLSDAPILEAFGFLRNEGEAAAPAAMTVTAARRTAAA